MYIIVGLFGKFLRLTGKGVRLLAGLCTWMAVFAMAGFAYSLVNRMIPGWAYTVMAKGNFIGNAFAWYYVNVYLAYPWVKLAVYYVCNWGGAVLTVLFRTLHYVFSFLAGKFERWGLLLVNKSLAGKARASRDETNAVTAELNQQIQRNRELAQENAKLRRQGFGTKMNRERRSLRERFPRFSQRDDTPSDQEEWGDVWGRWSDKK